MEGETGRSFIPALKTVYMRGGMFDATFFIPALKIVYMEGGTFFIPALKTVYMGGETGRFLFRL